MGIIVQFPRHARASRVSRAARSPRKSKKFPLIIAKTSAPDRLSKDGRQIRSQIVGGNSCHPLDSRQAISGNFFLRPPGNRRLIDLKLPRKINELHASGSEKVGKIAHGDYSCATNNLCQGLMLRTTLTTGLKVPNSVDSMSSISAIHKGKQPQRPHFIPEWAGLRGFSTQAELAEALDADKSVVSRWYNGTSPSKDWQKKLSALFGCEREGIFRHPDDDWIAKFFRDRSTEEIRRMKQMLEAAFPAKKRA